MTGLLRITFPAGIILWTVILLLPWLLAVATNVVLFVLTLWSGYWLLWRVRRALFNELVVPEGKSVLITGCDTGFGHLLAIRLAADGFRVYAGCLSTSSGGATILKRIPNVRVLQLDVTKEDDIKEAYVAITSDNSNTGE
ncbi:retinol dehydrogenase 5-like [Dermacentor silvarum]|uniref:retinol dehydrogenase 5-like n=1 Tax=Dermacentor silvarum TaxID=543639 RepID=UPI00210190D9|nr:retinol dehydrogenase 5-like [Dermacentor silvarum]